MSINRRGTPQLSYEQITPEMAKSYLAKNKNNRRYSQAQTNRHIRRMLNGTFQDYVDRIDFDWNGNLINGQHRLAALMATEQTHGFVVARGLNPKIADAMDKARSRTLSDDFRRHGMKEGQTRILAGIYSVIYKFIVGDLALAAEMLDYAKMEKTWKPQVDAILNIAMDKERTANNFWRAGVFGACAMIRYFEPDKAEQFFEQYISGERLSAQDPAFKLRTHVITTRGKKSIAIHDVSKTLNAFKKYVGGNVLGQLRQDGGAVQLYQKKMQGKW